MDEALLGGYVSSRMPGAGVLPDLDLADLPPAARQAAERCARTGRWAEWSEAASRVGWCSHPVRLRGSSTAVDTRTGIVEGFSSSQAHDGVVRVPCGNRRADKCPACSRIYARDTFELIRTGLLGGKQVPKAVATNPLVFVTMTAPSFGHVHGLRGEGRCRPRSDAEACPHGRLRGCHASHPEGDRLLGSPLCWECYDWTSAVVWQWHAPELWRRATIALRRVLAAHLGMTSAGLRNVATVQYAKVAEFQARGLVHFHALIRLDGPDGPGSPSPIDGRMLALLVEKAVRSVRVEAPPVDGDDVLRVLRFGNQFDAKVVRAGCSGDMLDEAQSSDELHAGQVAGYLAKYATKSTSGDGVPSPHHQRMERECWALSKRAYAFAEDSPYVLLGKWARMLGFRGHFSTKSRAYSVTLGKLRAARRRFARLKAEAVRAGEPLDVADLEAYLLSDEETTLVVASSWEFVGSGWGSQGDKELAEAAAARAREYAQLKASAVKGGAVKGAAQRGDG